MAVKVKYEGTSTDFTTFSEWLDSFYSKEGGSCPIDLQGWFDKVEKCHKVIRERIGGVSKTTKMEIASNEDEDIMAKLEDCQELINGIQEILPKYFGRRHDDSGRAQVFITKEALCSPTIYDHVNRRVKTSRHIMQFATREKLAKDKLTRLNDLVAQLGEVWATAKTKADTLFTTITTSPRGFVALGHYGPDTGSCFSNNGSNKIHKYNLGATTGSFVMLVRTLKHEVPEPINSANTIARMWGYYNSKKNYVVMSNMYVRGTNDGTILEVCKKQAAELMEISEDDVTRSTCNMGIDSVYSNEDAMIFKAKGSKVSSPSPEGSSANYDYDEDYNDDDDNW